MFLWWYDREFIEILGQMLNKFSINAVFLPLCEKNIEKFPKLRYNCTVKNPFEETRRIYGKKSWYYIQRHPLPHHPAG